MVIGSQDSLISIPDKWLREQIKLFHIKMNGHFSLYPPRYMWEKDGTILNIENVPRLQLDNMGTLHIAQTWSGDIGTYTCRVVSAGGNDSCSAYLRVR